MVRDQRVVDPSAADEPSAYRIPDLLVDDVALGVERLEPHAIGMRGEPLPPVEDHVAVVIVCDGVRAVDMDGSVMRAAFSD